MGKFVVTDPSGKKFEITAPDGATQEDVLAYAKSQFQMRPKATPVEAPIDPTDGMSVFDKFAAGVGKSVYDAGRGIGQLVGAVSQDDIKAARKMDAPLMNTGAGMAGDIAGTVGMALLPGGALKGAGMVAKSPALSGLGSTLLMPKTIPSALAVGGGMGFIQPAADIGERAINTGIGAGATAAFPVASRVWDTAKAAVAPFHQSGQEQIMGKLLNRVAGNQAPQVQAGLLGATELVPGSLPTAGQASGNAGIAALERAASAIDPTVTTAYAERMAQQNTARVNALRDMAGTTGARNAAAGAREAAAQKQYGLAYALGIDPIGQGVDPALKKELGVLFKTPALKSALSDAKTLAANEGVNLKDVTGQVKGLDYVKRALDDQIGAAAGNQQRILTGLKERYLGVIDQLSPEYAAARGTFRNMSGPINQMDIAQEIAKKSIRPLDDTLLPASYARAFSDDTAKAVTGMDSATLKGVMSPQQMGLLGNIKDDLTRAEFAKNAGRGAGSDSVQKLAYSNLIEGAGIPTWLQNLAIGQIGGNIASRAGDAVYGRANKEMATKLAQGLLTPADAGAWMQAAQISQNPSLAGLLARGFITPVGMAAPGLLQGRQ